MLVRKFAVLLAKILGEWFEPFGGIDELYLAMPVVGFSIGETPDISCDAGVV